MARKHDVKTLLEKCINRGDPKECLLNFLKNVSQPIRLKRTVLLSKPSADNIQTFIRLYLIALVSCLETFYRDLFRHLLDNAQGTPQLPSITKTNLDKLLDAGLQLGDVAAEEPGLQNANSVAKTLDPYFPPAGYISALSDKGLNCKIPSKGPDVSCFRLAANWHKSFDALFKYRHRYVHDANASSDMSVEVIRELETLVVLLPQLTTWLLDSPARVVVSEKGQQSFSVLLIVDDLAADDWQVIDNDDDVSRKDINK